MKALKRKKIKQTSLIIYPAHELFKIFVEKLTTQVIKKIGGDRERERREKERERERERERKRERQRERKTEREKERESEREGVIGRKRTKKDRKE